MQYRIYIMHTAYLIDEAVYYDFLPLDVIIFCSILVTEYTSVSRSIYIVELS